jgi:hypothetical protein
MPLDADVYSAIARFDAAMQQLDVRYALVGSVARHLYGEARFGYGDIDFVADLNDSHLEPLSKMFGRPANFILPSSFDRLWEWFSEEVIDSYRARCICQADYIWLSHKGAQKTIPIHVYIAHNFPSRWICLQRAQRYAVYPTLGTVTYLPHVEDLLIGEIAWFLEQYQNPSTHSRDRWKRLFDRFNLSPDRIFKRAGNYRTKEGKICKDSGVLPVQCEHQKAA